jgi:acetylornithine/succinyldiaminopimelate/putrescine aminotransferase
MRSQRCAAGGCSTRSWIRPEGEKRNAGALCYALKDVGLLAKPTHEHIIRLAPPLIITGAQIDEAVEIIAKETRRMFG